MFPYEIQPDDFQYILTFEGKDYVLPNAPEGWEETLISWARSESYTGLVRTFTVPLKLLLDGAWLARQEFYKEGIEGKMTIKVNKLNRSTWKYENLFTGDLDFSNFDDKPEFVEINAMEAGIGSRIKAYEGVKYTLPLDVADAINIQLPGIKLLESAVLIPIPGAPYPTITGRQVSIPLQIISNETKSTVASIQEVEYSDLGAPPPVLSASNKWFYQATVNGNIRLHGFFAGSNMFLYFRNASAVSVHDVGGSLNGDDFNIPFDFTLSVVAGQKIFLTGTCFSIGGAPLVFDGELNASYTTVSPPTMCKALRPKYVFQELVKKMNGGASHAIQSFLLDNWNRLAITSAEAIRQIPNPKLKTTFKEYFTSINAVTNAGLGIENSKVVLEDKSYFYKNIQATNVGVVKDFSLSPYTPAFYSSIKVGYPDQNYDEVNGRQEVNSEQIYSTPITRVQRELDLMSVYRADPYGIEFLRINLEGKDSTDSDSDNDVFFIYIKSAPETGQTYYRPEPASAFANVSGTTAGETIYNLRISPKRNLFRHGNYLRAMLDKLGSYFINFESAKKNVELVSTDLGGLRIAENQNVSIATLGNPLFLPYLATIATDVPRNLQGFLDAFPSGYIGFTFEDKEYKGFIHEASINNAKGSEREFKLLLTPGNDLSTLIR